MACQVTIAERKQRLRNKRGPGKGLLDWIKLCRSFKQQQNSAKNIVVTFEELHKHNKEDDCWTAFRGDVYNITHYLSFHPGGHNELMKAAGTDCTLLFNQVHSHVNLQSILVTFKVGTLATFSPLSSALHSSEPQFLTSGSPKAIRKDSGSPKATKNENLHVKMVIDNGNHEDVTDGVNIVSTSPVSIEVNKEPPTPTSTDTASDLFTNKQKLSHSNTGPETRSRRFSREQRDQPTGIKYTWHQTETDVVLTLTQQHLVFNAEDVTLIINNCVFEAKVMLGNWCYNLNIALEEAVSKSKVLLVESELQIILEKVTSGKMWNCLGAVLPGNAEMTPKCSDTVEMRYMSCFLEAVESVNYNSKMFTFKLPGTSYVIVPIGHHVRVKAKNQQDEWIERSYTPVLPLDGSCCSEGSEVKLMVKLYNNGAMSSILSSLHAGDKMNISLPVGHFTSSLLDKVEDIILIAAGSGFTPMVKVIRKVCKKNCESEIEKTTVKLLFFNRTLKDIMWLEELKSLSEKDPNFTVEHILSRAGNGWTGSRGRLSRHVLQNHMPPVNNNQLICVCGPTQFNQLTISTLLDMNFSENSIHIFE